MKQGFTCLKKLGTASVGPRFKNIEEVQAFLKKTSWSVDDLLTLKSPTTPNETEISKLLKLSGLPQREDVSKIQQNLKTQIGFINYLHSIDIPNEASLNPEHARILPRQNDHQLTLTELLEKTEEAKPSSELGEIAGDWNATSNSVLTKESSDPKQNFFILREGLIKNRK